MKKNIFSLSLLFLLFIFNTNLFAKQAEEQIKDEYFPILQADPDMKTTPTERKPFTLSYGGWITPTIITDKKITDLTTSITTIKLWLQSTLWQNSFIYVRGKDTYMGVLDKGDTAVENNNVIDLDAAYIGMENDKRTLRFFLGRKYYTIGSGLVFNGRGDGGEFNLFSRFVDVKIFGLYTGLLLKDDNPYGLSDKDLADGSKRVFTGGTIEKTYFNQTLYLMGMAQIDNGNQASGQHSRYQSQYFGFGLKGIIIDGLDYNGEFIHETGQSYTGDADKKKINSNAAVLNINYYLPFAFDPVVMFQYAFGSGDNDRTTYTRSTGNTSGPDNGFIYFGTYVGGFGLRPALSNLHIFRIGATMVPFYKSERPYLKRINLMVKYAYYMKNRAESPINYGEATVNKADVGHGLDLSLRWGIFYDLGAFINYGLFIPGKAWSSSEVNRNFVMAGINLIF